jgi:diguanylate cyclase (GGDEF)-like protein
VVTTVVPRAGGLRRRRSFLVFYVTAVAVAVAVFATHVDQVRSHAADPTLWVMTALAVVAGTQAFMTSVGPQSVPAVLTPAVSFGFAILISWGLGPAVVAQSASVAVVAWHLRRPPLDAILAAARYTLALAAASAILGLVWRDPPEPLSASTRDVKDAIAVVAAGAAWLATYGLLVYLGDRLARGRASRRTARAVSEQLLFKSSLLVLSPVLAVAAAINVMLVPLVLIPLYAVNRMARLSAERDRAARTDPLTVLDNRAGIKAAFDRLTNAAVDTAGPAPTTPVCLLVLDLDRFKQINDALGHDVGDQLLVAVAGRLPADADGVASVARLGGDEFAVLARTADPRALAGGVVAAMNEPVVLDGLRLDVFASIGIATHAPDDDFARLMRHADIAMYDAKRHGDGIAFYNPRSDRTSPEQLALLADFRSALEASDPAQIGVVYQPQIALATGKVEGVEALLRWRHPRYGPVPTAEIIALAEHTPVMNLLTLRMVERVTRQVAQWAGAGLRLRTSINVSARDLYSDDLFDHLTAELVRRRVDPRQIQIELTESALLADLRRAQDPLRRFAERGIGIALDDFGTGYSSLQHLRRLPITEIKIDQSFVAGIAHNPDDAAIVRSTVDLGRSLQIRTVAEGVEDDAVRRLVTEVGCDLAQGWHVGRPMPGDQIADLLRRHSAARPAA